MRWVRRVVVQHVLRKRGRQIKKSEPRLECDLILPVVRLSLICQLYP